MSVAIPRVANVQYRRLLAGLDEAWAGRPTGACRRGCDACCYGPFDVGIADIWLAFEALEGLPEGARRSVMQTIARNSQEERTHFGGALPTVDTDEEAFDQMCVDLVELPCPFLQDGGCIIYEDRPQPCRLIGAAWGIGVAQIELDCPIDLTGGEARVVLDVDGHELALARHESRLPSIADGVSRTTLATGIDALLRG